MTLYPGYFTELTGIGDDMFLNNSIFHDSPFFDLEDWWQDTPRLDDTDYFDYLGDDI